MTDDLVVVYDGACPLCRAGIRNFAGSRGQQVTCLDKRRQDNHPLLTDIAKQKLDINEGMVVHHGGRFYQGAKAVQVMAKFNTHRSLLARLSSAVLRHEPLARLAYPFLRLGRSFMIRINGAGPIPR